LILNEGQPDIKIKDKQGKTAWDHAEELRTSKTKNGKSVVLKHNYLQDYH